MLGRARLHSPCGIRRSLSSRMIENFRSRSRKPRSLIDFIVSSFLRPAGAGSGFSSRAILNFHDYKIKLPAARTRTLVISMIQFWPFGRISSILTLGTSFGAGLRAPAKSKPLLRPRLFEC